MSFWSNPIQNITGVIQHPAQAISNPISSVVRGGIQDIANIPQDLRTLVTDPKKQIASTLSNPGISGLAGAALVASGVGAPLAGLIVGGTDALATGSITKGVLSGIGAYGGANAIGDVAAGGANYNADVASASNNYDYTSNYANNLAAGVSNPSAVLAAASPGGVASDALHLGATALQAANGPNGNAILGNNIQSTQAATPTAQSQTGITSSTYNANPTALKDLNLIGANYTPGENPDTSERTYFHPTYSTPVSALTSTSSQTPQPVPFDQVPPTTKAATGGQMGITPYGINQTNPVSTPMVHNLENQYQRPFAQTPQPQPVVGMSKGGMDDPAHTIARHSIAADGADRYNLGGYSDGGRLLRGPGDGVSDSIPASIGHKQPARLADGEFVIPARHVSELGNGSTEAGARKLYAMLDRIQNARSKSIGKSKGSIDSKADKHLPA
jgi:hypothetical protein